MKKRVYKALGIFEKAWQNKQQKGLAKADIEPITKERLKYYIGNCNSVEIIPIKGNEPIFILKHFSPTHQAFGSEYSSPSDSKIVIHKGKFILGVKEWGYLSRYNYKKKSVLTIPAPDEYVSSDDYVARYKNKAYPSKEFSLKSILDKKIPLYGKYIKPIKSLFKKYGILKSKTGMSPKLSDVGKKRRQFVLQELKAISTGKNKRFTIMEIWNKWCDYVNKEYPNAKNPDKLYFDYTTIWRDCRALKNCIKK